MHAVQDTGGALVTGLRSGFDVVAVGGDQGELGGDESAAGQHQQQADAQGDKWTDQVHERIPPPGVSV